ncbi:hypothetical protein M5689_012877 [Euphorbia peplus]|nr:hypothetical protein M5689_012877 [Euphorbia peplus]
MASQSHRHCRYCGYSAAHFHHRLALLFFPALLPAAGTALAPPLTISLQEKQPFPYTIPHRFLHPNQSLLENQGLTLKHIMFGIAGSSQLWNRQKEFESLVATKPHERPCLA